MEKFIEDIIRKLEDTNRKLSDEANESKRRREENKKIKLMDIKNAKSTESINNFMEKYYYSTEVNRRYFDTQYNKMKNKIYQEYGNNRSKYKFNTLLKYLSEDFGVKHIKDDDQLIDNL